MPVTAARVNHVQAYLVRRRACLGAGTTRCILARNTESRIMATILKPPLTGSIPASPSLVSLPPTIKSRRPRWLKWALAAALAVLVSAGAYLCGDPTYRTGAWDHPDRPRLDKFVGFRDMQPYYQPTAPFCTVTRIRRRCTSRRRVTNDTDNDWLQIPE
jgi:hypothetical protein